ncbi:Bcr/CflA family drug resistance efflux transporter [Xenophilus aerolatus]|nr:Bcr/CflA family drug resistance efflux transporter [Xenophilus aerolatus]
MSSASTSPPSPPLSTPRPSPGTARHAMVLGLLTAIGPFAIDMYLPALPALTRALHADAHGAQASLMSFFFALGAGQLIAGPLSDRFGRKRPLYLGLLVFGLASIGCALAPSLQVLVVLRFIQGLGACTAMVTPRAVVRDLYTGPDAARLMASLLTVYSVSPILAPLAGSAVASAFGWRGVFAVLCALAVAALAMVAWLLEETRPASVRRLGGWRAAVDGYRTPLADRQFLALALIASCAVGCFFVYVANSAFVMTAHYGVSPRSYALLFALNALAVIGMSRFNGRLVARFGLRRLLRGAVAAQAALMLALLLMQLAGGDALGWLVLLLMAGFGLNALILPSAFVLAMERHAGLAGAASALIGTANFAGGAIVMAAVSPFADGTPLPMVAGIAACSAVALAIALGRLGVPRAAP